MKKALGVLVVAVVLIASCAQPDLSISSASDAAKASAIVSQAIAQNPTKKSIPESYIFNNTKIIYEGETYTLNGAIEFTFSSTQSGQVVTMTITCKSNNLTITGPDLDDTIIIDITSIVAADMSTRTMSITVTGTCAGYAVNSTATSTF